MGRKCISILCHVSMTCSSIKFWQTTRLEWLLFCDKHVTASFLHTSLNTNLHFIVIICLTSYLHKWFVWRVAVLVDLNIALKTTGDHQFCQTSVLNLKLSLTRSQASSIYINWELSVVLAIKLKILFPLWV